MILKRIFRLRKSRTAAPGQSSSSEVQALVATAEEFIRQGDVRSAVPVLERALRLQPGQASTWHCLAVAHLEGGSLDDAERCCRMVLQLDGNHAKARANLGAILQRRGQPEEAELHYRAALELDPQLTQCRFNLGMLLLRHGRDAEGIENIRRAVEMEPSQGYWHFALGSALNNCDRPLEARSSLEVAVRLAPHLAGAHEELARSLVAMGEAEAAVPLYRRASELDPDARIAASNALLALNYLADGDPEQIFREHVAWARRRAAGLAGNVHQNEPSPERRIKVAYVSPDFRSGSVAYFLEPVLARHDRAAIELICYSDSESEDHVTQRLRRLADTWRRVESLSDEDLARLIRSDRVDILVDLAGHTAGGKRMLLFARKAAPVQASWLGYLNTTGLDAVDYRITDWHASPAGWERYYTERLVRLPNSQWCCLPAEGMPDVGPLPARRQGVITFGAFHNFAKVNPAVIRVWSRVLQSVPESRLLLLAPGIESMFRRVAEQFARQGVAAARLEIQGRVPVQRYLDLHNSVDICLDTFPYTGGTTTCHALWMGVPVVSLAGRAVVSRGGASLLTVVGLPELVAATDDQYVETAAALARDLDRLGGLRRTLRDRVAASPLADAVAFTRDLEGAYRSMWREWCARQQAAR